MPDLFSYTGAAEIDGVQFSDVLLLEHPPERGLRSWSGSTYFEEAPPGFIDTLGADGQSVVRLADGREGLARAEASYNGRGWTVHLTGTGPAPS
ncbi:hypothetical protein [Streptomyces sp. NRRL B-24720]|uniref:hypothetical protein n=1 Tax=Streptomyces sp. NRRL B-24720 TaxID=1476876 RepID=UPI0004C8C72C|nr:hypothetical protein [Streptomyces sp. NRRL B-24720]